MRIFPPSPSQLESGSARTEEQERRAKVLEGKLKFKTEEVTKLEKKLRETRSVEVEGARRRLEEARAQHGREVQRQERRAEEAEARCEIVKNCSRNTHIPTTFVSCYSLTLN